MLHVKNSFCDATIPGLIRNGKEKWTYTYLYIKERHVCYHGSFSLYSCHRPECYEEMLLCCVLLFLHSDTIAAHTSLWCLRGKLSWGKFFLDQRLFRRHSSHPFVSRQSQSESISSRDSAQNLFAVHSLYRSVQIVRELLAIYFQKIDEKAKSEKFDKKFGFEMCHLFKSTGYRLARWTYRMHVYRSRVTLKISIEGWN